MDYKFAFDISTYYENISIYDYNTNKNITKSIITPYCSPTTIEYIGLRELLRYINYNYPYCRDATIISDNQSLVRNMNKKQCSMNLILSGILKDIKTLIIEYNVKVKYLWYPRDSNPAGVVIEDRMIAERKENIDNMESRWADREEDYEKELDKFMEKLKL